MEVSAAPIQCIAPTASGESRSRVRGPHMNGGFDGFVLREDDTCYLLTLEMPGVIGKDIQVSLHGNIICIGGYRRCSSDRCKRQRISRHFEIDTTAVDLDRAVATKYNKSLVLYAPKRRQRRTRGPLFHAI